MSLKEAKQEDIYDACYTELFTLINKYYPEHPDNMSEFLDDAQKSIGEWATRKGWNRKPEEMAEWCTLNHEEISEAWTEFRNHCDPETIYFVRDDRGIMKPEGILVEFADAVIRHMHFFEKVGVPLLHVIILKMAYNETREHRHGGKRA